MNVAFEGLKSIFKNRWVILNDFVKSYKIIDLNNPDKWQKKYITIIKGGKKISERERDFLIIQLRTKYELYMIPLYKK